MNNRKLFCLWMAAVCAAISTQVACATTGPDITVQTAKNYLEKLDEREKPKDGIYYAISPDVLKKRADNGYLAARDAKTLDIPDGYIAVLGRDLDTSDVIKLAYSNRDVLYQHYSERLKQDPTFIGQTDGIVTLNVFISSVNAVCKFRIGETSTSDKVFAFYGNHLSKLQFCQGFGLVAALYGYKLSVDPDGSIKLH